MKHLAAFPGSITSGNSEHRSDVWKEYNEIRQEAADHARDADSFSKGEDSKLSATLAVAARLEALTYLISKARIF